MQNTFSSKVFVENRKKSLVLRVFLVLIAAIIVICVLIKLVVGDFRFSDISGILLSVLIIFVCKNQSTPTPQYAAAIGNIAFEKEKMIITYADVDGGKSLGRFTETTVIPYEDIESIQYGNALSCYRIVGKCLKKRYFEKFSREKVLENAEKTVATYLYVLDEDEDVEIRRKLQKYSGCIVGIVDAEEEEEE